MIIEVVHFSIFGLSLFKRPVKRTMMMFMKPATNAVYITAYAVQDSLKEVRIVISLQYTKSRDGQKLLAIIFFLFTWVHLYKDGSVYIKYEPLSYHLIWSVLHVWLHRSISVMTMHF